MKLRERNTLETLPRLVIFDLDNTLYPYEPAHRAGIGAAAERAKLQLGIDHADFLEAVESGREAVKAQLKATAASHSRLLYFKTALEQLGLGPQVAFSLELDQAYWRAFLTSVELHEEVPELLDDLRLLGITTALVTDLTMQIQFRKLVYFQIEAYFDCVVASEEVGVEKPHSAPFELALSKLGMLDPRPAPIWAIGDDPHRDILGAQDAVGAVALIKVNSDIRRGAALRGSTADGAFHNYSDIRSVLARLSSERLTSQ